MKILLIGSKGMLASALVKTFSEHQLTLWDKTECDISNSEAAKQIEVLAPELVINAAAYTAVDDCETQEELANAVNGRGVQHIALGCRQLGIPVVHYSTDYVFDGTNPDGYREDAPTNPVSAYGRSKLLGERLLSESTDQYYIIRTSGLYGANGKNFVDTMLTLAHSGKDLSIVNDQFCRTTFTDDLAEATKKLVEALPAFGIYHFTNDETVSWFDFATEIFRLANLQPSVTPVPASAFPRPAKRPQYSTLLNTKRPPLRSWREALAEYLQTSST